jgi:hypothetical protein
VWWKLMDWIDLAEYRDWWWTLVNAVMNLRVPWNTGNLSLSGWGPVNFSGRTLVHGVIYLFSNLGIVLEYYKSRVNWTCCS